jgi:DNA-binding GntR family transcriptional regulator
VVVRLLTDPSNNALGARKEPLAPIDEAAITSAHALVVQSLRKAILNAELRPGERLQQDLLARQLGVSRQPVREALRQLESEGLVSNVPRRGAVVREYSEAEVKDNYALRKLLETFAAQQAARRITDEELVSLAALHHAMADAVASDSEPSIAVDLNTEFHRVIHTAAAMPALDRLMAQLWVGFTVFTPLFVPNRASKSVEEHDAIVTALTARDPEASGRAMSVHLDMAASDYFGERAFNDAQSVQRAASDRRLDGTDAAKRAPHD